MGSHDRILVAGCRDPRWRALLDRWNRRFEESADPFSGLSRLACGEYEIFVFQASTGDMPEVVEGALAASPGVSVAALTDVADPGLALRLAQLGLADLIGPPREDAAFFVDALTRLEQIHALAGARRPGVTDGADPFGRIIGESAAIRRAVEVLRLIAPRRSTVLIHGPTGCGKELAARAVHHASPRKLGPFVEVNCAAIPESLFESELFGHVKGAFTGAVSTRAGSFEQAHGGTLFLDEVGELPLEVQPKLLRALQEREIRRVGGKSAISVDVRVVAATHRDLERMVSDGAFREDLYYRLAVVPAPLPSVAERLEDVPALVQHFLERFLDREGLGVKRVSDAAMDRLSRYCWPGNVRQLENAVEKAAVMSGDRVLLTAADFSLPAPPRNASRSTVTAPRLNAAGLDYDAAVADFERSLIGQALELTGGNKKRAAELLRMKRTTLNARWKVLEEIGA